MTFEEWLTTEDGKSCMRWPVTHPEYLRNRLWWAFNAGAQYLKFANREQADDITPAAPATEFP